MKITYQSCDGARKTRTFKTLAGARKFAQEWVGKNPEMGSRYAISGDGIGKITAEGVELRALFGDLPQAPTPDPVEAEGPGNTRDPDFTDEPQRP